MKKLPPVTLVAAVAAIGLLAAACGDDDTNASGGAGDARTVEVEMVDIAFEPDSLQVADGETVRFVFTNNGEVPHDAFVGDTAAQNEHEQQMRDADEDDGSGMDHEGDDSSDAAVTVEPGETAELTYTFDEAGEIEIGCHQPDHYDAGMKIAVEVA